MGWVLLVLLSPLLPGVLEAGPAEPVYPTYEGYAPNEDGTVTLVFGYYNPSPATVNIPAGEANGFSPGPPDRGQPTTFLPGRQRHVCRMVLPADYEGNLLWTLSSAGQTIPTTERGGVDQLYLLEESGTAARAAREIDTAKAVHGTCINRSPVVSAGSDRDTVLAAGVGLRALVRDDGLPRGSVLELQWSLTAGPRPVSFSNPASALTEVSFTAAGTYTLELRVSDGEKQSSDVVIVKVAEEAARSLAAR